MKPGPFISDQCAITSLFKIKRDKKPIKTVTFRNYKDKNTTEFFNEMDKLMFSCNNLHTMLDSFNSNLTSLLEIHAHELLQFVTVNPDDDLWAQLSLIGWSAIK